MTAKRYLVPRLMLAAASAAGLLVMGAGAAGAATVHSATAAVRCTSPRVWLRLWGSLGETCYRGNGNLIVDLPGVGREKIIGRHIVCLAAGARFRCANGPATFRISPPARVTEISIRTP